MGMGSMPGTGYTYLATVHTTFPGKAELVFQYKAQLTPYSQ